MFYLNVIMDTFQQKMIIEYDICCLFTIVTFSSSLSDSSRDRHCEESWWKSFAEQTDRHIKEFEGKFCGHKSVKF